jgi:hypothetical protein
VSVLLRQPRVGESVLAVEVEDEPRHLAAADVEEVCSLRLHSSELQPARPAAPTSVDEHEDTLIVQLAVVVHLATVTLPGVQDAAEAFSQAGQPRPATGCGPVGDHVSSSRGDPGDPDPPGCGGAGWGFTRRSDLASDSPLAVA